MSQATRAKINGGFVMQIACECVSLLHVAGARFAAVFERESQVPQGGFVFWSGPVRQVFVLTSCVSVRARVVCGKVFHHYHYTIIDLSSNIVLARAVLGLARLSVCGGVGASE